VKPKAGMICCYAEEPLCLVSNSTSTPPNGIDAQLVVINGTNDKDYEGIDVSGKIIFTNMPPEVLKDKQGKRCCWSRQ